MKLLRYLFIVLFVLVNFVLAQSALADPNLTKSPDYAEVTQSLTDLLKAKNAPDNEQQSGYTPEEIEQKIGQLHLQKYILETAEDWAQCSNKTGKTLAVYAHKPKRASQGNTLYYLADGQITDDDWDCDGIYLPSGAKVAGLMAADAQEEGLTEPLALTVVDGTQFVATANRETGVVEFNISPAKVFRAGEANWSVPNLSQADIDSQVPNAPIED